MYAVRRSRSGAHPFRIPLDHLHVAGIGGTQTRTVAEVVPREQEDPALRCRRKIVVVRNVLDLTEREAVPVERRRLEERRRRARIVGRHVEQCREPGREVNLREALIQVAVGMLDASACPQRVTPRLEEVEKPSTAGGRIPAADRSRSRRVLQPRERPERGPVVVHLVGHRIDEPELVRTRVDAPVDRLRVRNAIPFADREPVRCL